MAPVSDLNATACIVCPRLIRLRSRCSGVSGGLLVQFADLRLSAGFGRRRANRFSVVDAIPVNLTMSFRPKPIASRHSEHRWCGYWLSRFRVVPWASPLFLFLGWLIGSIIQLCKINFAHGVRGNGELCVQTLSLYPFRGREFAHPILHTRASLRIGVHLHTLHTCELLCIWSLKIEVISYLSFAICQQQFCSCPGTAF